MQMPSQTTVPSPIPSPTASPIPSKRHSIVQPTARIRHYQDWLQSKRGLVFDDYDALWRWSVTDLDAFWQSIWDYFDLQSPTPHTAVLADNTMPGATWFPGAQFNYARQVLRHAAPGAAAGLPAIVSHDEQSLAEGLAPRELTWPELKRQVASLALHLRAQGVKPGDRVAAYLPNIPETIVAFLATASIGGVWSLCAPDMGTPAVLDRFRQIEPSVLIACTGVRYGGKDIDRSTTLRELCAALPTVRHVIVHAGPAHTAENAASLAAGFAAGSTSLTTATSRDDAVTAAFEPMWLPFDHPLWIVYSSGTTGLPKPIVHGHGGVAIVALALGRLHNDIGPSYSAECFGERFHWYSSTGWIMWNVQVAGLLDGTTCCLFDGNPAGSKENPDWGTLWRFVASSRATFFGAGAAFFASCMKAGVRISDCGDLSQVRILGTTGSPLSEDVQRWGTAEFESVRGSNSGTPDDDRGGAIFWANISGGTDFAGAFIAGNRELPLVPGEMQCRVLGCAVEAWNEAGEAVLDEVGELVCTQPLPSMPLYFVGDPDLQRYRASYFETYPPGHGRRGGSGPVWRHGDWLKVGRNGGCVIYGRSDATINRHGLRMGTSEVYSAIEALPEVLDSMVVDLEYLGRESYMPLFVVLRPGIVLDDGLRGKLCQAIRDALSPRFVPNDIFEVPEIPRTLSGKKQELPIKKLLLGQPLEKVVNRDAMANPSSLDWYVDFARRRAA
ncbi:MAG: acetoacetate--CoA ligase [Comamonadaceae bacterium]|nr:MAG: acetoacetate--CoA ligase [Comamonadaceae bacterium]